MMLRHFFWLYSFQHLNPVYNDDADYNLIHFLLKHIKTIGLSLKFFRFIILFNLIVTGCILLQSPRFMLSSIGMVSFYMFIFWFKVIGSIISFIAEYIFHLPKKEVFLKNLHISPISLLIRLTIIDFLLFIILCWSLKIYLMSYYT
ncbi:hypothetical protein D3C87_139640 [compost metagenome]